jgi:hypothetical protein
VFRAYQQESFLEMAGMMAAAGLVPYLQFGEFLWWYFGRAQSFTVSLTVQTITFGAIPGPVSNDPPFTLAPTANFGLARLARGNLGTSRHRGGCSHAHRSGGHRHDPRNAGWEPNLCRCHSCQSSSLRQRNTATSPHKKEWQHGQK